MGKYKSDRAKHNGLYMIDDYMRNEDRSPRFNLEDIEEVLEEDYGRSELLPRAKIGKREHLMCSEVCINKGKHHLWGTEKCCLANSFTTGVNTATLYHQRLGHVSLKNPKLHKRLCDALGDSYKSSSKLVSHCEGCVYSKATNLPFAKKSRSIAKAPLEKVFFDVIGPIPTRAREGTSTSLPLWTSLRECILCGSNAGSRKCRMRS